MALPIRQRLGALTCLKAGPKAVLIEVCELHENGGRGCFASNDTLSKKLGVSLATVTRTVASLVGYGLLSARVVVAEANRRYLAPAAAVCACYKGGTEAEQLAAAAKLTIVKTVADYSQNSEVTIVKNGADYSQNASRVIGDEQDEQKTTIDEQAAALLGALAEVELLKKKLADSEAEADQLKADLTTLRTLGGPANEAPVFTVSRGGKQEPVGFEQLYDAWPKKKSRQDAARAFKAMSVADREAALVRANAWLKVNAADVGRENNRYLPNLATWINGKRWTDAQAAPSSQANPQANAVHRSTNSYGNNAAAARLQTPTPDATSANPWGLPAYTPPASAATLPGGN